MGPAWARVEGDAFLHVSRNCGTLKTLCDRPVALHIVRSIPEPPIVDCPDCLSKGAYNLPKPKGGWHASAHSACLIDSDGHLVGDGWRSADPLPDHLRG